MGKEEHDKCERDFSQWWSSHGIGWLQIDQQRCRAIGSLETFVFKRDITSGRRFFFLSQPLVLSCGSFSSWWWVENATKRYEYGCIKIICLGILSFTAPRIPWLSMSTSSTCGSADPTDISASGVGEAFVPGAHTNFGGGVADLLGTWFWGICKTSSPAGARFGTFLKWPKDGFDFQFGNFYPFLMAWFWGRSFLIGGTKPCNHSTNQRRKVIESWTLQDPLVFCNPSLVLQADPLACGESPSVSSWDKNGFKHMISHLEQLTNHLYKTCKPMISNIFIQDVLEWFGS